jgi:catechol 2,3-dioxygenase-like lactoylglutathione lyase family enzyme
LDERGKRALPADSDQGESTDVTDLRQVALRVKDLGRVVVFYRDVVGLELIAQFESPGLAFFDLRGSRLLLETGAPQALVYLGVDDVTATTDRLRANGVAIESEPHTIFVDSEVRFGSAGEAEEMAFFRDSEDNVVGLAGRRVQTEA